MSEPLIYISTFTVTEGKVEEFKRFYQQFFEIIMAKEPQLIAVHGFLNEDETEFTSIQFHPDPASMDFHMEAMRPVLGEEMDEWVERGEYLKPLRIEIYGKPSVALLEADRALVESGIPRAIRPIHVFGFTRSSVA